eukprot:13069699-Heterocapsa_arctica.AAC.1
MGGASGSRDGAPPSPPEGGGGGNPIDSGETRNPGSPGGPSGGNPGGSGDGVPPPPPDPQCDPPGCEEPGTCTTAKVRRLLR